VIRFEFGIGKLIGGAIGTVGWVSRKPPVSSLLHQILFMCHERQQPVSCGSSVAGSGSSDEPGTRQQ